MVLRGVRFPVVVGMALAFFLTAVAGASAAEPKEKPEKFTIMQVDDEYQVIRSTELKDFQKGINDKYTEELKQYKQAKKDAVKNKEKFDQPMPTKPKVKQISKVFNSEDEASSYVTKLREEKEKEKKLGKK